MKTFQEINTTESFYAIAAERQAKIDAASSVAPGLNPVNVLAKRLHPDRQYMKIAQITELAPDTKCYRFVPDPERGTTECAPFLAGQYLNIHLTIDGMPVNRAYSISSSPRNAREGYYELTIKSVADGLVSRYVLENWKVGDAVELSGPAGNFYYSPLRDAATVVCLAGGSGITPFLSLAHAIVDGDEDFHMILLYGSRTEDAILYKAEFDELAKDPRIDVVHILSDEERPGYEHGFISADVIRKYAPTDAPYSVFVCGSQGMYRFVDAEVAKLDLPRKYFRQELYGEVHDARAQEGYPGTDLETVKITVSIRDVTRTVTGSVNDTILQTLEKNGITVPTSCRSGECGYCHSILKSGEIFVPKAIDGRRLADFKFGGIHPCAAFPLSDLEIIVPADK